MKHAYGYFPAIFWTKSGFSAHNALWGIKINPEHPYYAAQLAQERYEYRLRMKIMGVLMLVGFTIGLAIHQFIYPHWAVVLLAMVSTPLLYNLPTIVRSSELMGHAIEVVAANKFYASDITSHLESEARNLHRSYWNFRNMSVELITTKLRINLDDARDWVYKYSPVIARDLRKAKEYNS